MPAILLLVLTNLPTILSAASAIVGGIEEVAAVLKKAHVGAVATTAGGVVMAAPDQDTTNELQALYDKYGPERTQAG